MAHNEHRPKTVDIKLASIFIAVTSIIGLTICFVAAAYKKVEVPLFLYAIFGGGILGTDNVLKFIRAIFRIGNGNDK